MKFITISLFWINIVSLGLYPCKRPEKGEQLVIRNFRLYLTLLMIVFSIFIASTVAFLNQEKMKNRMIEEHEMNLNTTEDLVLGSLHTIDKAYMLFDGEITEEMKAYSKELLALYEQNPKVDEWDYDALKERFDMDVYVLNENNRIIHSSFEPDIGRDFQTCCPSFSKLLDKRRAEGKFFDDGMDIQQETGELTKFSYVPTPDRKYLLELGISLEDGEIFKHFNFFDTIQDLEERFSIIESIKVYNIGGYILGANNKHVEDLTESPHKLAAFNQVKKSGQPHEIVEHVADDEVVYRYIPYKAQMKRGFSTNRVVEIAYNQAELKSELEANRKEFAIQLAAILAAAILISLLIDHWIAKPMYLAFHDSLTGLKNRAAFEEEVKRRLKKGDDHQLALMMIDLDNFKLVNDHLGHTKGDRILKYAAYTIRSSVNQGSIAARLGGDEFVVVFPQADKQKVRKIANQMINEVNVQFQEMKGLNALDVSISVGIAFATEEDNVDSLYEKADIALYEAKKRGKNQYYLYKTA